MSEEDKEREHTETIQSSPEGGKDKNLVLLTTTTIITQLGSRVTS